MATQAASFDPDKTLCCKVENGHTLVHGSGGRGYGLGATAITSGCYQWKVGNVFVLPSIFRKGDINYYNR